MNPLGMWERVARLNIAQNSFGALLILGLSVLICLLDLLTGPDFTFSTFYLLPPALAAWKMTRPLALFAAIINSISWLWADLSSGRYALTIPVYTWNFSSRLISLLIFGVLISMLREAMEHEKQLSRTDHLTNALNVRAFREMLNLEINRALRYQHPLTLVYLDIDNFKLVNDTFGHEIGNNVLATFSSVIRASIRQNDILGRLGGDEFAILHVETDPISAHTVVSNLQDTLIRIIQENKWPISISFGVLSCTNTFCSAEEMINLADQLMYSVKKSSKNNAKYAIYSEVMSKSMIKENEIISS